MATDECNDPDFAEVEGGAPPRPARAFNFLLPPSEFLKRNADIGAYLLEASEPGRTVIVDPHALGRVWHTAWCEGHAYSFKRIRELEAEVARLQKRLMHKLSVGQATLINEITGDIPIRSELDGE